MFGLIISGRPVDASAQAISQTQYAFRFPSTPTFSHIALFLLPGTSLPPDAGALVYIQIPPAQDFRLLGALAASKQSAIFKLNAGSGGQNGGGALADSEGDVMVDEGPAGTDGATGGLEIVIGLSIEPAAQVEAQLATLKSAGGAGSSALVRQGGIAGGASPVSTKVLAQRIIGNAFNFLASFGSETVPLKSFQDWWLKFEKKVELDPGFLEREQG